MSIKDRLSLRVQFVGRAMALGLIPGAGLNVIVMIRLLLGADREIIEGSVLLTMIFGFPLSLALFDGAIWPAWWAWILLVPSLNLGAFALVGVVLYQCVAWIPYFRLDD